MDRLHELEVLVAVAIDLVFNLFGTKALWDKLRRLGLRRVVAYELLKTPNVAIEPRR